MACRYGWPLITEFRDEAKEEYMHKVESIRGNMNGK